MSAQAVRIWLIVALCLIATAARGQGFAVQRQEKLEAAPTRGVEPSPQAPAPVRYVMTISGGISLGAYEAGLNWALLRYLKKHTAASLVPGSKLAPLELVAATGASAGNINAFLTAVGWCQTSAYDDKETPSNNLFWKAWVPIGLKDLFPGTRGKYEDDDGLFTRNAFRGIRQDLAAATATAGRFTPECKLPIGITVTRNRLGSIVLNDSGGSGAGLQIATQRFVVTLDAQASAAGLAFHERPRACDDQAVGQYLHLPGTPGQPIPVDTVLGLVEASSAFPLAFGPKAVRHCFRGGKRDPQCAMDPEVPGTEAFFDGGVFDNVPLGLGVSLALPRKPRACPTEHSQGDIEFLYVDPERRRRGPSASAVDTFTNEIEPRRGLSSAFEFLQNFIQVSRQYELQTAARYVFERLFNEEMQRASSVEATRLVRGDQKARQVARLRLTSRFYPLVGRYMGAFGAFFAQSFRQYDYYVGMYDALFGVAEAYADAFCAPGAAAPADKAVCLVAKVLDLEHQLGISGDSPTAASFVMHELLRAEVNAWLGDPKQAAAVLASVPVVDAAALPASLPVATAGQIKVMAALVKVQGELVQEETRAHATRDPNAMATFAANNTLVSFVDRFHGRLGDLNAPGVREQFEPSERSFVNDPDAEMRRILVAAAERQADIEEAENYQLGTRAMALTQFVLHSEPFRPSKGRDLDPSSVPDNRITPGRLLAHLLPYSISGDVLNGGTNIEYRPGYWFVERVGIGVPFSPIVWQSGQGGRMLAAVGVAGLLHIESVLLPELQLSFRFTQSWRNLDHPLSEVHPGAELAAYLLAGKLRLSVGIDDFAGITRTRHAWSVKLGLADLNGLTYWAMRFLGG